MSNTTWWKGPVKAEPDFDNITKVFRRQKPGRPTLFELFYNDPLFEFLAGPEFKSNPPKHAYKWEAMVIRALRNAGQDACIMPNTAYSFPGGETHHAQTKSLNEGFVITDRASFEKYAWPDPDPATYERYDVLRQELRGNMKFIVTIPGGPLENLIALVGFDNLCYMLADDPELVTAITDALGERIVKHVELACQYDTVGMICGNDDFGFKTQPMLSPADMRKYILPWHKRLVEVAHRHGKLTVIHSCGQNASLMDDIIDTCKYDAKHPYEDVIQPVEEAYEQYHDRIAVVGGMDIDFMCRATPEDVYRRAKAMLERTADRGGYALGTGNSIPAYIPNENAFAMWAAALEDRR